VWVHSLDSDRDGGANPALPRGIKRFVGTPEDLAAEIAAELRRQLRRVS
jgi:hypothetical protein